MVAQEVNLFLSEKLLARSYIEVRLYPKHTQDSLLRLLQETRYGSGIKGPVEFGIVVDVLQYRDSQAVLFKQFFIFNDVDLYGSDPCPIKNRLRLFAEVAEPGAVKSGIYPSCGQFSTSSFIFSWKVICQQQNRQHR
jgi:hypothetical protein